MVAQSGLFFPEQKLPHNGGFVRLIAQTGQGSPSADEISIAGALGCFEERPSSLLLQELHALAEDKKNARLERLAHETSGRGHGSVLDQSAFVFSLENVPRAVTLQLCQPEYLSHLQQSLRRASAERGAYLPASILEGPCRSEVEDAVAAAFAFYEKACAAGIAPEDARYPLPISVRTHIQTLAGPRELMHLDAMSRRPGVPQVAAEAVRAMIELAREQAPHIMQERERSYEVRSWRPAAQLYAQENAAIARLTAARAFTAQPVLLDSGGIDLNEQEIEDAARGDEAALANLKHLHFTFLLPLSLNGLHQALRQRTWHHSLEPLYAALRNNRMVVPPAIRAAGLADTMAAVHNRLSVLAGTLAARTGIAASDAVLLSPHSLVVHGLVHLDGWNVLHSLGKRLCTEAQWEIRSAAAAMAAELQRINSPMARFARPQGVLYGKCPERSSCGLCESMLESGLVRPGVPDRPERS